MATRKEPAMPKEMGWRNMVVHTYHPTKGDATITAQIVALRSRNNDDPFFADQAAKLAKKHGKVVSWSVSDGN